MNSWCLCIFAVCINPALIQQKLYTLNGNLHNRNMQQNTVQFLAETAYNLLGKSRASVNKQCTASKALSGEVSDHSTQAVAYS